MLFDLNIAQTVAVELAAEIARFLVAHGGYTNGFNTFAEGSVALNQTGGIAICINNDDLSRAQLNKLADKLEENLHQILIDHKCPTQFQFRIRKIDGEHGCCTTKVSFTCGTEVPLYRQTRPAKPEPLPKRSVKSKVDRLRAGSAADDDDSPSAGNTWD
jgi:hypothetical protein